jgi:peroxiredoxin
MSNEQNEDFSLFPRSIKMDIFIFMRNTILRILLITVLLLITLSPLTAFAQQDAAVSQEETMQQDENASLFRSIGMLYLGSQDIPDFEVIHLDGGTMHLSDLKGKIVFLNFWATWCPPCQMEMPSMERLYGQFKDTDFVILAVSVGEDVQTVKDFLSRTPYSFPIALNPDGKLGSLYAARGIPSTYVLNREGKIMAAKIGAQEWDTQKITSVFEQLLNQED